MEVIPKWLGYRMENLRAGASSNSPLDLIRPTTWARVERESLSRSSPCFARPSRDPGGLSSSTGLSQGLLSRLTSCLKSHRALRQPPKKKVKPGRRPDELDGLLPGTS